MEKKLKIQKYEDSLKSKWDDFVLEKSANGTILQTRFFLEYHDDKKFVDNSLLFMNENNIIALLPANIECMSIDSKALISHRGSTFGGFVIGDAFLKISWVDMIMEAFEKYIADEKITEVVLKQTGSIFCKRNTSLLDYYLSLYNYQDFREIGFYIDFADYKENTICNFSSSKRRDYRYAERNNFTIKELETQGELKSFYDILCDNYEKFDKVPIHSLDDLIDFKFNRLKTFVSFYGVYLEESMIAGGMVFHFCKDVFHTQYLAVKQKYKKIFANDYLYKNMIEIARSKGYKRISFGTSTLNGGKVLNKSLALYKEGYGTQPYINYTYKKEFDYGQSNNSK